MDRMHIRQARPADYDAIAAVVDGWWGRPVVASLPRLFLQLFYQSSLVVDGQGGPDAFLCGILSPSDPERAYIHFVGVAPDARQHGIGRQLYEEFFRLARADARTVVTAVTSPGNAGSVAFHRSMGFTVTGPVADYHGPGRDLILFERELGRPDAAGPVALQAGGQPPAQQAALPGPGRPDAEVYVVAVVDRDLRRVGPRLPGRACARSGHARARSARAQAPDRSAVSAGTRARNRRRAAARCAREAEAPGTRPAGSRCRDQVQTGRSPGSSGAAGSSRPG
jgi:ribosomal protein S18 acetylase RimI-like enzyme